MVCNIIFKSKIILNLCKGRSKSKIMVKLIFWRLYRFCDKKKNRRANLRQIKFFRWMYMFDKCNAETLVNYKWCSCHGISIHFRVNSTGSLKIKCFQDLLQNSDCVRNSVMELWYGRVNWSCSQKQTRSERVLVLLVRISKLNFLIVFDKLRDEFG